MNEAQRIDSLLLGHADVVIKLQAQHDPEVQRPSPVALFEPRMRDLQGHFSRLAETYQQLFTGNGTDITVFHHQDWQGPRPDHWHALFSVPDHVVGASHPVDAKGLNAFTAYFRHVLDRGLAQSQAQFAVFPTARFLTLPAIAETLTTSPALHGAVIGVMETFPVPDCADETLVNTTFRAAARTIAKSGLAVLFVVESNVIARWLIERGFPADDVIVAPYPAAARFPGRTTAPSDDKQPAFAALGASRPVHNPGLLAAYLLSNRLAAGSWTVRLNTDLAAHHLDLHARDVPTALQQRGIRQLPNVLGPEDYDLTLRSADVMLLPYGDRYRAIGSGIFLECLCAGVIPLVPAGSTMRGLYEQLGGRAPAIKSASVEAIAEAVDRARDELDVLLAETTDVRRAWLDHEYGPRTWSSRVLERYVKALQ